MKIGIIGAGFTGLSAAYRLSKLGHEVTIIEAGEKAGGLAVGYKHKNWKWNLEKHYHHWFTNDNNILNLAKETGFEVLTKRPKTSTYIDGKIYQLDSPVSLLMFEKLPLISRVRTGIVLAYLKITSSWKMLEKITAKKFLINSMGIEPWNILWRPLFEKKFGKYSDEIPASWFWARVKKRTPSLSYPKGGFDTFSEHLTSEITKLKAKFKFNEKVSEIKSDGSQLHITTNTSNYVFDKVICTLPTDLFVKVTSGLPVTYIEKAKGLKGIGAVNLVLRLNKQFLTDGTYWLNINENDYPFLAIVEHTNFMNKKHYGDENIMYVGNYLESDHPYFSKSSDELLKIFEPYLQKVNSDFSKDWVIGSDVFKAPFAQPVVPLNYSKKILPMVTPIDGLFLANIQQVYPWDRGTNYAVELGEKVAQKINKS